MLLQEVEEAHFWTDQEKGTDINMLLQEIEKGAHVWCKWSIQGGAEEKLKETLQVQLAMMNFTANWAQLVLHEELCVLQSGIRLPLHIFQKLQQLFCRQAPIGSSISCKHVLHYLGRFSTGVLEMPFKASEETEACHLETWATTSSFFTNTSCTFPHHRLLL